MYVYNSAYVYVVLLWLFVQKSPHHHNGYVKRSPSREYANSSRRLFSPSRSSHTGSPTRLTRNALRSSSLSTRTKPFTGYRNGETRPQYVCSDPDNKLISPAKQQKLSYSGSSGTRSLSKQQRNLPYSNGHSHQQTEDVFGSGATSSNPLSMTSVRMSVSTGHVEDRTGVWRPRHRVLDEVPIKHEESELKVPFRVKYECSTSPPSQSLGLALKTSPISRSPSPHSSPSKRPSPALSLKKRRNSEGRMFLYEPLSPSPPDRENVSKRRRSRSPTAREQDSMPDISPIKSSCRRRLSVGKPQTPSKQTKLDRFLDRDVTLPIKRDPQSPAIRDVTPEARGISPAIQDVTPMAQDISPAVCEVSQTNPAIPDISPTTQDITPAICDMSLAISSVHPPIQDMGPAVSPAIQSVPTRETFSLPCWSDSELNMIGEACTSPLIEHEVLGIQARSGSHASPASVSCWNWVEVYMEGDSAKFVEALEEINSRGCYIPDTHVDAVLRRILRITDCNLLIRVHSILVADVSYRSNSDLSANKLWELMEDCCRTLLQVCTPVSSSSCPRPYPHSAHVVMLHLMSLLAKDVTTHKDNLTSASIQCILSPVSQWRHVMVTLDLLQQLLLNRSPSPPPLPDLLPGLAGLLCMSVSTSSERDYEEGANRLARELSSRMSRLPSVHLKLDFLLLFPCYLLREKTISIHLTTEFVSSQTPHLPPERVTLELISTAHFCLCPYRRGQSSPDLLLFLSLLYHLLHSHCSKLLGPSFLHPDSTSWNTPPSKLAHQLESIASQIRHLPQRLAEDDAILPELTSPSCWFYLQLLERMFNWESLLQFT